MLFIVFVDVINFVICKSSIKQEMRTIDTNAAFQFILKPFAKHPRTSYIYTYTHTIFPQRRPIEREEAAEDPRIRPINPIARAEEKER